MGVSYPPARAGPAATIKPPQKAASAQARVTRRCRCRKRRRRRYPRRCPHRRPRERPRERRPCRGRCRGRHRGSGRRSARQAAAGEERRQAALGRLAGHARRRGGGGDALVTAVHQRAGHRGGVAPEAGVRERREVALRESVDARRPPPRCRPPRWEGRRPRNRGESCHRCPRVQIRSRSVTALHMAVGFIATAAPERGAVDAGERPDAHAGDATLGARLGPRIPGVGARIPLRWSVVVTRTNQQCKRG